MFLFYVFNDNIIDNEESGGIFLLTFIVDDISGLFLHRCKNRFYNIFY